ncbi:hypothetical protein P4237_29290 [Pseudomonas aeruginosa]|nr:hypothetical protein [Pseudomonas aeruginosa]
MDAAAAILSATVPSRLPVLDAQCPGLAEPIHFSEEVPFLLLDVQRCQDCRELIWLLQPGDLGHAEHLLGDLVGVTPGQPHLSQLRLDDLDLGG